MQKLSLSSDSALLRGPSKAVAEESAKSAAVERLRGGSGKSPASFLWNETVELTVYFALWYWGNTYYNIYNKKAMNLLGGSKGGLVWTVSSAQLFVGILWVIPLWILGIRTSPKMTADNWKQMAPIGLWAAGAHGGSVISLGAAAVSFAQILKACEPVFSAANEALLLGKVQAWPVYAALLPIIGGVALASVKELSFSWLSVISAMIANQCAALKGVQGKDIMKQPWVKAMGPANQYGVVNMLAFLWTLPIVFAVEGPKAMDSWNNAMRKGSKKEDVLKNVVFSGLTFYLYNEVSFLCLGKVTPITHSVANTLKRVVVLVVSCIVFNTPVSRESIIGSTIAILGTLLYSLAKQKYGGGH